MIPAGSLYTARLPASSDGTLTETDDGKDVEVVVTPKVVWQPITGSEENTEDPVVDDGDEDEDEDVADEAVVDVEVEEDFEALGWLGWRVPDVDVDTQALRESIEATAPSRLNGTASAAFDPPPRTVTMGTTRA